MNQYTFELTAQHRPEVLERVLRVIRLRGFTVKYGYGIGRHPSAVKNHCKI